VSLLLNPDDANLPVPLPDPRETAVESGMSWSHGSLYTRDTDVLSFQLIDVPDSDDLPAVVESLCE